MTFTYVFVIKTEKVNYGPHVTNTHYVLDNKADNLKRLKMEHHLYTYYRKYFLKQMNIGKTKRVRPMIAVNSIVTKKALRVDACMIMYKENLSIFVDYIQ